MRVLPILLSAVFVPHVALAEGECPEAPRPVLDDALHASSAAWSSLDGKALDEAMATVRAQIACLTDPADLDLVIEVHQAHARHAWTTYEPQMSARAWLAVRDLAPEWTDELEADVPPDHPVRELWANRQAWTTRLDEEPPGGWVIDGSPGNVVPRDRAFWIQALDRDGRVAYSAWHASATDVPQAPWRLARIRRVRTRGTAVASVVALGGAAALGGALVTRTQILNTSSTANRDLLKLERRYWTLIGVGAGGLGTGALSTALLWGVRW